MRILLILPLLLLPILAHGQFLFWDQPRTLSPRGSFPQADHRDGVSVVFWQERQSLGGDRASYTLSCWVRDTPPAEGSLREGVLGPFVLAGEDAPIFSFALGPNLLLWLAVQVEPNQVVIYRSSDLGRTFLRVQAITGRGNMTNPRIRVLPDGLPALTITEVQEQRYRILFAYARSATDWAEPQEITRNPLRNLNFNPAFAARGRDIVLVYQSLVSTPDALSYQLYLVRSTDGGQTWGQEVALTELIEEEQGPFRYQNDRPSVLWVGDEIWVAWERTPRGGNKRVVVQRLGSDLRPLAPPVTLSPPASNGEAVRLFDWDGQVRAVWFDDRRGPRSLNVSLHVQGVWIPQPLSLGRETSVFGSVLPAPNGFTLVGQTLQDDRTTVFIVDPDVRVEPPVWVPQFVADRRQRPGEFRLRLSFPSDPSGIAGFNYAISRSPQPEVEPLLARPVTNPEVRFTASEEGDWWVHAIVRDGAGNWSQPASVRIMVDATPPAAVVFEELERDEEGYLPSNTFSVRWFSPDGEAVAYSYRLEYLGTRYDLDTSLVSLAPPPPQALTTLTELNYTNLENGLWALSVSAIDEAGNVAPPATVFLPLRRFIPFTRIDRVIGTQDEFGSIALRILGRGFLAGGTVIRLWLEGPDGQRFPLSPGQYRVLTDREIQANLPDELEAGTYRVALEHSLRGVFRSGLVLSVDVRGNVKIGDFRELEWHWREVPLSRWLSSVMALPMLVTLALLGLMALFFTARLVSLGRDRTLVETWRRWILSREIAMPEPTMEARSRLRGLGLQVKFIISILSLTVTVILMLSITLGFFITENSQRSLGSGLLQRAEVLLDSLATSARNTLPDEFVRDLALIPSQRLAMRDALSVTITGRRRGGGGGTQYVWASDDPDLGRYIQGPFVPGESLIQDEASAAMADMEQTLNAQAAQELEGLIRRLVELTAQSQALILRQDAEAERQRQILGENLERVNLQIQEALQRLGRASGSVPPFDPTVLSEDVPQYLFYKPVLYILPGENTYVNGFVRLRVSVEAILEEIRQARAGLIQLTGLIALAALALGLLGSLLLSAITVRPINTLVKAVAKIRDTEDKEKLKGFEVKIRTGDELALLADTINEMTDGLVKAAMASKDLILGKEIQKMFIPLQTDSSGRKMTFGQTSTERVDFFGYYEGAKGVSGDYFDFTRLDDRHWAVIKCDVAGKGVPAALIMIEVATIFLNYFRDWSPNRRLGLSPLAARINTLLEERGFKGRFAALIIGLYDTQTGKLTLCNAGDTVINVYSAREQRIVTKELPKAPAAGVFPTDLVELQGGFKEIALPLAVGDTVFFYTDGVEESKRLYRDANCQPISVPAASGEGEISDEEIGPQRIHGVIEAVFNQTTYLLDLPHSPWQGRLLEFDFRHCDPTPRNAVLAVVGVEKIWRLIPNPALGSHDRVKFDRAVYEFLRKHFVPFEEVFRFDPLDDELPEYIWAPGLAEDEQYDDLTLLALTRKA